MEEMTLSIDFIRSIFFSLLLFGGILRDGKTNEVVDKRNSTNKKVEIEVFYSPFDDNSFSLIQSQIFTVMDSALGKHVKVKMYPVGSCKTKVIAGDRFPGRLSCPNGPDEETAVVHHLCAIDILDKASKTIRNIPRSLFYVLCTLEKSTVRWRLNFDECRSNAGESVAEIEACVSRPGDSLITFALNRLDQVNPQYYPFLVINGNQSVAQDEESRTVLWKVVCNLLDQVSPADCGNITAREADTNRTAEDDATIPVFLSRFFIVPLFFSILL